MNPQKSPSLPPQTSPGITWGSPALLPSASFPPMNQPRMMTPPHTQQLDTRQRFERSSTTTCAGARLFGPGFGPRSPQMGMSSPGSFRTPQPQRQSPYTPRAAWSDNRVQKRNPRFQQSHQRNNPGVNKWHDSPRGSPNVNPGGSDNIQDYYSPAMLEDPWTNVQPRTVDFWKQ